MSSSTAAIVGILLMMAILVAGTLDHDSEVHSKKMYCDMTALYQQTQGEYGWPEYKENIECP